MGTGDDEERAAAMKDRCMAVADAYFVELNVAFRRTADRCPRECVQSSISCSSKPNYGTLAAILFAAGMAIVTAPTNVPPTRTALTRKAGP